MPRTTLRGDVEMRRKFARIPSRVIDEVSRALYQEVEIDVTEVKRRTPVDLGALRASVMQDGPVRDARSVTTSIVAGGVAAPYAVIVHEDLTARHTVGQAKFVESVINDNAPYYLQRIARRVELNRVVQGA